jgi:predicted AAA+ superfamily ATPase
MPRDHDEERTSTAINPAEAVEEKVSMADRRTVVGFHPCGQRCSLHRRGYAVADAFRFPLPN